MLNESPHCIHLSYTGGCVCRGSFVPRAQGSLCTGASYVGISASSLWAGEEEGAGRWTSCAESCSSILSSLAARWQGPGQNASAGPPCSEYRKHYQRSWTLNVFLSSLFIVPFYLLLNVILREGKMKIFQLVWIPLFITIFLPAVLKENVRVFNSHTKLWEVYSLFHRLTNACCIFIRTNRNVVSCDLVLFLFWARISFHLHWPWSPCVMKDDLLISLPSTPECWSYGNVPYNCFMWYWGWKAELPECWASFLPAEWHPQLRAGTF